MRNFNADEAAQFARLTLEKPFHVRFIELMPTVSQDWWERYFLPMGAVRRRLAGLGRLSPAIPAAPTGN